MKLLYTVMYRYSKSYTVFKASWTSPTLRKSIATFLIAVEMKIIPLMSDLYQAVRKIF